MSEPRKLGILDVTFGAVSRSLDLPPGNEVIDVRVDWRNEKLEFKVEGPDMPEYREGDCIEHIGYDILVRHNV